MKRLVILLLVVVLGIALAVFFLGPNQPGEPLATLPELAALAPADAVAVFYIDAERIRASAMLQRITRMLPVEQEEEDYAAFVRGTGFDYTRDLHRALIALRGKKGKPSLAWVEGRFDPRKVQAYAKTAGSFVELPSSSAGKQAVFLQREKESSSASAFQFVTDERMAWAHSEEGLEDPARAFAAVGPLPVEMQERLRRIAGAAVFGVARLDPPAPGATERRPEDWLAEQFAGMAESMRWASFALRAEEGRVRVQIAGECDGVMRATQLGLVMDGLHLLARQSLQDPSTRRQMTPQQYAAFEHIVQNAAIERESNIVYLRFDLNDALLASLERLPAAKAPK